MKNKLLPIITAVILLLIPKVNFGQTAPTLGTTSTFALFTAGGAFSVTGASSVTGNVGTFVGAFTGFPPGSLLGQIHVADPASSQAATDVAVAYSDLTQGGSVIGVGLGNGQILLPGVYQTGAASTLNGDLVLDGGGNPNALFVIRIGGAFATGAGATVTLKNLASVCNVYWQIGGQFDLETGSVFRGTLVVDGPINLLGNSSLLGRGLSKAGAISLANNVVTNNSCVSVAPAPDDLPTPMPAAPTVTVMQTTCLVPTGTITIVSPTETGMTYSIDNSTYANTTGTFTLVQPGTYTVTSKNSNGVISAGTIVTINLTDILVGCVSAETIVTINAQPVAPSAPAITLIQPTCILTTGTIIVTSPTETGMTYSIDDSTYTNTTGTFTLVPAGTYNVTFKNSNGCISTGTILTINAAEIPAGCVSEGTIVTINAQPAAPAAPAVTLIQPTCIVVTGTIMVVSPIETGMTYSIDDSTYTNTTGTFTLVQPGAYNVTFKNSNGCISAGTIVTINTAEISEGCVSEGTIVTINTQPGAPSASDAITGTAVVCKGHSGFIYSVPIITNATDYIWTLPTGATITAGENTNSITVVFSESSLSGNITVQGSSSCATGPVSSPFAVVVNKCGKGYRVDNHGSETPQNEIGLKVYPNPFTDHIYFELQLVSDAKVRLEIFNIKGYKVATVFSDDIKAFNNYRIEYTPENNSSGVLVYRLIINKQLVLTGKLIHK